MPRLVAHFEVEMPGHCLVAWPEEAICVACEIHGFSIAIELVKESAWRSKYEGDAHWTCGVDRALVTVSQEEDEFPPPVIPDERGRRDYSIQVEYFRDRSNRYGEVAREAVNRLIRFFRYSLRTPLLREFGPNHQFFRNARWTNDQGEEVGKSGIVMVAKRIPGEHGEMGVGKLTPGCRESLELFLSDPRPFSLFDELLSDAQSAWFEGNLRRAVLELAIVCEVVVKRRFFSGESPAGAAFDYLEDKARVNVRVLELTDRVATEAFGKSFRIEHASEHKDIDHLFRCRNKVAHRGDLSYREDGGAKVSVDAQLVAKWWQSVVTLNAWLSNLSA